MMELLLLLAATALTARGAIFESNYTQEYLLTGLDPEDAGRMATHRKHGSGQGVLLGRGRVLHVRVRSSGHFADYGDHGLGIFYRQYMDGNPGDWEETAHLLPDDLPTEESSSFYLGIYQTSTATYLNGRTAMRLDSDKYSVGGTPETKPIIMASAFGHTYTGGSSNGFTETGQVYIFTGEYYHWTQATTLRYPTSVTEDFTQHFSPVVEDNDYHFGRCVSIDKQTQNTAAISCPGCDPGTFKTAKITGAVDGIGSQGRGAVYIYQGSEATALRQWTATQLLWPRHNKWYYFGGGFTQVDGGTMVVDACKGAACVRNTFVKREYDAPTTDLFVFVKQEVTGLWSEQQVLTDPVMEVEYYSKYFMDVELHDDTIAMGITLQVLENAMTQGTTIQRGQVLVWYPNKPSYILQETFRHQTDMSSRRDSNSALLNQHQWSLQQFLVNEVASTGTKTYFGQYVSISGDNMVIGARGFSGTQPGVNLYTRPRQGGFWSQQQILVHPDETKIGITTAVIYNNLFSTYGVGIALGTAFVQYQSEMAHGKWTCLLVSLFDEFGDGWDTAKLKVSYSDGTYDYYYPDCNSPNPLEFEYCPSMHHQGGTYTFEVVHHEEARFNWEIEWKVQMNLNPHKSIWGNSTDVFLASRHSRMSFYWNPISLSFEKLETSLLIPSTVSCQDCPNKEDDVTQSHRSLLAPASSDELGERENVEGGSASFNTQRILNHAAHTASPTVSPAPTVVAANGYFADWEKLVMTTSNPLQPWFKADRSGTYFMLSDLQGKRLIRKDAQCGGGLSPLEHSCWLNYPHAIPDGEYIARIGGARAGQAAGLHSWSFCGVTGGQSEHLQVKVENGQCYPVQRFTKTRFCSFKEGSGVLLEMTIDLGLFDGAELSTVQKQSIFSAYTNLLPNTQKKEFSITGQRRSDDGHMHVTVGLSLNLLNHGYDPSDFSAVSRLEAEYNTLMHEAASSGALASALTTSFKGSGAFLESKNVHVELMKYATATVPRGPIDVDDDDAGSATSAEAVSRDWLEDYESASPREVELYSVLGYLSDAVATCGYIGLFICAVYGAKSMQHRYRQHAPQLEKDLEAASSVVQKATKRVSRKSQSRFAALQNKVLSLLDSFSDYVVDGEVTHDATTGEPLIAEVVIPSVDQILPKGDDARTKSGTTKNKKAKVEKKAIKKNSALVSNSEDIYGASDRLARFTGYQQRQGEKRGQGQEDDISVLTATSYSTKSSYLSDRSSVAEQDSSSGGDEESVSVFSYESSGSSSGTCSGSSSDSARSSSYKSSSESSSDDDQCYVMQSFK